MTPIEGGFTPADHASIHENGGRDEISLTGLAGTPTALTTHEADYELHAKLVRKTADQTVNNSTTLVNDDHLLLALGANEVWAFHLCPLVNSGATPDIKFGWTVPSGASGYWNYTGQNAGATTTNTFDIITGGTNARGGFAGSLPFVLHGIVICGATAGNLQFQWAQNTANASDTKVLTNSYLIATQLV